MIFDDAEIGVYVTVLPSMASVCPHAPAFCTLVCVVLTASIFLYAAAVIYVISKPQRQSNWGYNVRQRTLSRPIGLTCVKSLQ